MLRMAPSEPPPMGEFRREGIVRPLIVCLLRTLSI